MLAAFAVRSVWADQPIVENYVGRQIPTAMVARNLERGSGFLRPELDTGPFPNLFLVEPPIYACCVVAVRRWVPIAPEPAGRFLSALATVLGAWGVFGLAKRREGSAAALWAVAAFVVFPLTLRYGRAFQPDALMLGTLLAGLRCWDEHEAGAHRAWLAAGWIVLTTALALKVIAAYVMIPLIAVVLRPPRRGKAVLALTTLVPALLWYVHAALVLRAGAGSGAMAENATTWLRVLIPSALLRPATYGHVLRFLVVRGFTPLGFALGIWGLSRARAADRLWSVWGGSALLALAVLAGKLHHEYYWLALAPLAAVGVGRALADLWEAGATRRFAAVGAGLGVLALSAVQSASTWQTPREWASLLQAAADVRAVVPKNELLIAPEALLYYADRRGYRLEFEPAAEARALRELGIKPPGEPFSMNSQPITLLNVYWLRGAHYFADLSGAWEDDRRRSAHDAIRTTTSFWSIVVDKPGVVLIAGKPSGAAVPSQRPEGSWRD